MAIWDPRWVKFKAFSCFDNILLAGHIRGLQGRVQILNLYAPYKDHAVFWDHMIASEILDLASLIITVNVNYIIDLDEV